MEVAEPQSKKKSATKHTPDIHVANAEYGHVTLTQSHFDDLHAALQRMQLVVDESNAALKTCKKDMESMRKVYWELKRKLFLKMISTFSI